MILHVAVTGERKKAAAWKDVKRASCHADAVTFIY